MCALQIQKLYFTIALAYLFLFNAYTNRIIYENIYIVFVIFSIKRRISVKISGTRENFSLFFPQYY